MIEQNAQYQFALQGQIDTANRLYRTQAELAEARQIIGKLNADIAELKANKPDSPETERQGKDINDGSCRI